MTFAGLLADIVDRLDRSGVPYMVTGSLASSYHGEPRSTRDVDIVVDPDRASLGRLVDALIDGGFSVDRAAAFKALVERSQFNAIDRDAVKVDLIIRKDRPFSIEEFGRRQPAEMLGTPSFIVTAEDLVLTKLEWAAASGSDRQLRDAAAIVAIDDAIDTAYIERWADTLGVAAAWRAIQDDPG